MSSGSGFDKSDLVEQNRRLQDVIRRLNKENEKLIEEAKTSMNEDLREQAREVEGAVRDAKRQMNQVENRASEVENEISKVNSKLASAAVLSIAVVTWIGALAGSVVLWIQEAGVHPKWVTIPLLSIVAIQLMVSVVAGVTNWALSE